jgi:hypothetical protein
VSRHIVIVAALALGLIAPASAQAGFPSKSERHDALRFARAYWEDRGRYAPCYRVSIKVLHEERNTMGFYTPMRPCTIFLNRDVDWTDGGRRDTWWQVCATVIHEYGHVVGRGHSSDPNSIMARAVELNHYGSWWPWFPDCRYNGDDEDDDGYPDW